jgi:hypothetical protein
VAFGGWLRLTGRYSQIKAQNERETLEAWRRDRAEKDAILVRQIGEMQTLQRDIRIQRTASQDELLRLREDVARYQSLDREEPVRQRKREQDGSGDDDQKTKSAKVDHARRRRDFE